MAGYEIRVLSHEEFDTLPYKKANKALGLADAKTGVAYVRHTGVKDLDEGTISHEFDELLMKVSPHEEDGIRYKLWWVPILMKAATMAVKAAAVGAIAGGAHSAGQGEKFHKGAGRGAIMGAKIGGSWGLGSGLSSFMGGGATLSNGMAAGANAANLGANLGGASTAASLGPIAGGAGGAAGGIGGLLGSAGSGMSSLASSAPAGASLMSKFGSFVGNTAKNTAMDFAKNKLMSAFPGGDTSAGVSSTGGSGGYGTEGSLSRFNPELYKAESYSPISQDEYDSGVSNLLQGKQGKTANVFGFSPFRGQTPGENTALAGQLSSVNKGYDTELGKFNTEVNTLDAEREYNDVRDTNGFDDATMKYLIDFSQRSPYEISKQITKNSPEEFKSIFAHLKVPA